MQNRAHMGEEFRLRPDRRASSVVDFLSSVLQVVGSDRTLFDRLVAEFLLHQGLQEPAFKFLEESNVVLEEVNFDRPFQEDRSLEKRAVIRKLIMDGCIPRAIQEINSISPTIIDSDLQLSFHLRKQALVELIRNTQVVEAIQFAQKELAPLISEEENRCSPPTEHLLRQELEEVMSLLIFDKEVDSPVSYLFRSEERLSVAVHVNSAIMRYLSLPSSSAFEKLLKYSSWSDKNFNDANGMITPPKPLEIDLEYSLAKEDEDAKENL